MAIVPLNKITLYGTVDQKEAVLEGLHQLGCLHLLDLRPELDKQATVPRISDDAYEALKYLEACPVRRRPVKDLAEFDFDQVYREALDVQRGEEQLQDERDQLRRAIKDVKPWGEFQLPDPAELGDLRLWFYIIPHYRLKGLRDTDLIWQVVARDPRFDYVVVFSPHEPQRTPTAPVRLDARPLSQLRWRLETVELELEDFHWQRVALTRWTYLLSQTLAAAEDRDARQQAAEQTFDAAPVFAVQGWTPRDALSRLQLFSEQQGLALTVAEPAEHDTPPTLLRNPERWAGGEEAVTFYMTPGYRMWDPSLVVFFSFCLFFAMIFADAGYALLLGLVLLLGWRKLARWQNGIRLRNLLLALVITSTIYGMLVGTYFGLKPAEDTWLARLYVLDSQDLKTMMLLAILIGVFHLGLANLAKAWLDRRTLRVLAPLGWIAIFLGGLSLGLGLMEIAPRQPLVPAGSLLVAGGAVAVLLFSSSRPFFSASAADRIGRLLDGVKSLAGISQAFGDVLSYLRLFALGLATTQLAVTFNDLARDAVRLEGLGVLLAGLVVIVGHGLNFTLATLSGVVHGLRLICIEFFNWGLPEEGYAFRAFSKKAEW